MPGQHGQTYDPTEEPAPRGGWFSVVERPYPERLDRALKVVAAALGVATLAAGVLVAAYAGWIVADAQGAAIVIGLALVASALVYGFVRGVGLILVGVYGTLRDGPEFVVDWRALRHDLRLRRTRIVLLEAALLLAAQGGALWGLALLVRQGSAYGGAMFVLIQTMTYWPYVRRWLATGQAPT